MKLDSKSVIVFGVSVLMTAIVGRLSYKLGKVAGEELGCKNMFMNWFGAMCEANGLTMEEALKQMNELR